MKKVLIVEDDDAVFFLLSRLLTERKYSVIGAQTIKYGNCILHTEDVDCIVMDLGLRDGRSTAFIQQLHHSADLVHIPVVVHAAQFNDQNEAQRLLYHADRVILKSRLSPLQVVDAVAELVSM